MKTRKEIKAEARDVLGHSLFCNQWLMFLLVEFVVALISGALSYTFIGLILLGGPISFALARTELRAVRRETEAADFNSFGDGFKDGMFAETLVLFIMENIFLILWTLLLIIPGIIKSYSYSQAFYIKSDNPDKNWRDCITESRVLMRGHKWQLFVQDLSFIGWMIVGALLCGIGTLWVVPYYQASRAIFYNELIGYKKPVADAEVVEAIPEVATAE